jgi:hypothetical protein
VVKALLENDLAAASREGSDAVSEVLLDTHASLTTEEFEVAVKRWLESFRHPRFGVAFSGLVYAPMIGCWVCCIPIASGSSS